MIRVYDHAGNVIATHEHKGDFVELNSDMKMLTANMNAVHPVMKLVVRDFSRIGSLSPLQLKVSWIHLLKL